MYLIDTNVLSELPRQRPDAQVLAWFGEQKEMVISAITLEELAYGVARAPSEQATRLQRWFEHLLALPPSVIPVDGKIAHAAGRMRANRDRVGRSVAQADMLIAATAATTGRILVTRNTRDFEECGIALLNPFSST